MIEHVYNFSLDVTWQLIHKMSQLDRFDAQWTTIEKREGQSLKQLKSICIAACKRLATPKNRHIPRATPVVLGDVGISSEGKMHTKREQNTKPDYQIQERYLNFIQIE